MSKRVLITGAAGFVGSRLVRCYLEQGAHVRAMLHESSGPWAEGDAIAPGNLEMIRGDLASLSPAATEAFAGQDLVIHAAAVIRTATLDDRVRQRKVNVDGTRSVIEACLQHRVPRLLYVSTTAAVGITPDPGEPADEDFAFNLEHLDVGYNLTKRAAEEVVLAANSAKLETVVVNLGFVFGWSGATFRGADVIGRVLRRRAVVCTPGGLSVVHIDDAVHGVQLVAERGTAGERYILSGENVSFREIADTVCRVLDQHRVIVAVPSRATEMVVRLLRSRVGRVLGRSAPLHLDGQYAYHYYSSDKARRELSYAPRPFERIVAEAAPAFTAQ